MYFTLKNKCLALKIAFFESIAIAIKTKSYSYLVAALDFEYRSLNFPVTNISPRKECDVIEKLNKLQRIVNYKYSDYL